MTGNEYEQWWQLHLRVATGETLGAEDEQIYRTGLALLEREEADQFSQAVANHRNCIDRLPQFPRLD